MVERGLGGLGIFLGQATEGAILIARVEREALRKPKPCWGRGRLRLCVPVSPANATKHKGQRGFFKMVSVRDFLNLSLSLFPQGYIRSIKDFPRKKKGISYSDKDHFKWTSQRQDTCKCVVETFYLRSSIKTF